MSDEEKLIQLEALNESGSKTLADSNKSVGISTKDSHVSGRTTEGRVKKLKNGQVHRVCNHFLPKKNRHCRLWAMRASNYCAEHSLYNYSAVDSQTSPGLKRIPCPYNPNQ